MRKVSHDWKKVAANRLQDIKCLKRQCAFLRENMAVVLERELLTQFHAHCFQRSVYENKLRGIAEFVAERVRPKLP